MSAFGGKADVIQGAIECPLIAISGHRAPFSVSGNTLDYCPNFQDDFTNYNVKMPKFMITRNQREAENVTQNQ